MPNAVTTTILLVEDDERLATLVSDYLTKQGFTVIVSDRGDTAISTFKEHKPDLVILDIMLPGLDGFEICKAIRNVSDTPVLMLTAKSSDIDQVLGLELGADDYVIKPADPRVLVSRIKALLRRQAFSNVKNPKANQLICGNLVINKTTYAVHYNDELVDLTTQEFDLLWLLVNEADNILSRDTLYRKTKGIDYNGLDRSIDVAISRLRKKLGDDPQHPRRIKTIRSKGYLLVKNAWATGN